MKLKPTVDMRGNNLRPLCLLAFTMLCWVFVRTSFLQNPRKPPGHLSLTEFRMYYAYNHPCNGDVGARDQTDE